MKSYFRRFLMYFHTIKKSNEYFNYKDYSYFAHNNVNNECLFADREVVHMYFSDVLTELIAAKSKDNIRKAHSSLQQCIDI